jgi:hypothetical protein
MLKQHDLFLSRGELSQLFAACQSSKKRNQLDSSPIVQHLNRRMDAKRSPQRKTADYLKSNAPSAPVSKTQQQSMQILEKETPAAISAQLASAFGKPHIKRGLTRLLSHQKDLEQLIRRKWAALQSDELHFGLDHRRTYPIVVKVPLLQDMGLVCLTFIPGKLKFPSVTVSVELSAGGRFTVELIDGKLASVPPYVRRVLSGAGILFLNLELLSIILTF